MAEVWRAVLVGPAGFRRAVVVKRILPHLSRDAEFVELFLEEARLTSRLAHPNIVQVFELGEVDGQYFMSMEHVRGRDLVAILRRLSALKRCPPAGLAAVVVRDICRALAHAHDLADERGRSLGLVHRDISPSNVMVTYDGHGKLLDFGVAKALFASEKRTATGSLRGKVGYMSPQQALGEELDQRSDLYAAGIVLHELLTGRRLFKGKNELATLELVRLGQVPSPIEREPSVPPALDALAMRALAFDPAQRFTSAREMTDALDEACARLGWDAAEVGAFLEQILPAPATPDTPDETSERAWRDQPSATHTRRRGRAPALAALGLVALTSVALGAAHLLRAPAGKPVPVLVTSTPPGAHVFDDVGVDIGTTPLTIERAAGAPDTVLTLRRAGYEAYRVRLTAAEVNRPVDAPLVAVTPVAVTPVEAKPAAPPKPPSTVRHGSGVHVKQERPAKPARDWNVESILPPGTSL